jgi:hypothetical protein
MIKHLPVYTLLLMSVLALPVKNKTDLSKENIKSETKDVSTSALDGAYRYDGKTIKDFKSKEGKK